MRRKIMAAALAFLLLLGTANAEGLLIAPAPAADAWGVALSVTDVTPTGLTLTVTRSGGNPTGDLQHGADFGLEVWKDNTWEPVEPLMDDVAVIAIAYAIPEGESHDHAISWEWLYGALPAGEYRVCKNIMDFRGAGDYDEKMYYAEFSIEPAPFTDVTENDAFFEAVEFVRDAGLMRGKTETTFDPHGTITRGQLVTILWRLEKEPVVNYLMTFSDVDTAFYYGEAIRWAAAEQIVNGYGDNTFRPDAPISRQQLAAILWRYAKYKEIDVSVGEDTNILSYNDAFTISEYAIPAIQWACGAGVMHDEGGWLYPAADASRAYTAQMLMEFLA